jgi:hypothetical protein
LKSGTVLNVNGSPAVSPPPRVTTLARSATRLAVAA